tara:strand:- start:236 stop:1165 length:930 start_codon:yes stop_codon:yes gene_type:complete
MNSSSAERKVTVTGAAGFIGRRLCASLLSRGYKVTATDQDSILRDVFAPSIDSNLTIIPCDVTDSKSLEFLAQSDVVFHLAAMASPHQCNENLDKAFDVNVNGTLNVLQNCTEGARLIFMSGGIVYGPPTEIPISETHPLGSHDVYSTTKVIGERLTLMMNEKRKLNTTVVRNFSTYGPGQTSDYIIPTLIEQASTSDVLEIWNGEPTRDFTYVDDTVEALILLSENYNVSGEIFNLGSGVETSIGKLAKAIASASDGIPVVDLKKDVVGNTRQCCDNSKLRSSIAWEPKISLDDGISITAEHIRNLLG